jgi:hypothetical protein
LLVVVVLSVAVVVALEQQEQERAALEVLETFILVELQLVELV